MRDDASKVADENMCDQKLHKAVIMEAVFGIPGVGRWIIDAINFRDYPQLQVALLFIAIMVMVSNLLVDLFYGWLDPRVHYD